MSKIINLVKKYYIIIGPLIGALITYYFTSQSQLIQKREFQLKVSPSLVLKLRQPDILAVENLGKVKISNIRLYIFWGHLIKKENKLVQEWYFGQAVPFKKESLDMDDEFQQKLDIGLISKNINAFLAKDIHLLLRDIIIFTPINQAQFDNDKGKYILYSKVIYNREVDQKEFYKDAIFGIVPTSEIVDNQVKKFYWALRSDALRYFYSDADKKNIKNIVQEWNDQIQNYELDDTKTDLTKEN